jgi:hypothetical protein
VKLGGLFVLAALFLGGANAQALRLPSAPRCPIFPANNAWNQRADTMPVASNSAQIIASIGLTAGLHPDFGSGLYNGEPIGIPFDVVTHTTSRYRLSFEYADESDKGPYPIPKTVHIEGGHASTGDRHAILIDKDACRLYELYALYPTSGGWKAGSGAMWNLRSNVVRPAGWTSADAAGLPIFPGLARYDEVGARRHRPCTALHGRAHATRVRVPRSALRVVVGRSVAPADGAARAAEGERRHLRLPAAGADRAASLEDLRDDRRRQRLELVHQRRAQSRLVERRPAYPRPHHGLGLRGGRHELAPPVKAATRSLRDPVADVQVTVQLSRELAPPSRPRTAATLLKPGCWIPA